MSFIYNKAYARPQEYNLWNVDNTSDAMKPISDAAQAEIDAKLDVLNPVAEGVFIVNSANIDEAEIVINSVSSTTARLTLQENNQLNDGDGYIRFNTSASNNIFGTNRMRFKQNFTFNDDLTGDPLLTLTPAAADQNLGGVNFIDWETTNRQYNSQPIRARQLITVAGALDFDLSSAQTNIVLDNVSKNHVLTFINPFDGKVVNFFTLDAYNDETGTTGSCEYHSQFIDGGALQECIFQTTGGFASSVQTSVGVSFTFIADTVIDGFQTFKVYSVFST